MSVLEFLRITGLLAIGCALRFVIPYVFTGLEAVGRDNSWKSWPPWEWRYLTSFLLSLMAYGLMMLLTPGTLEKFAQMAVLQVILMAYAGQDVASRVVKPFRKK